MKITINIPASRVRHVKRLFEQYEIPTSHLHEHFKALAEDTDWRETDGLALSGFVYPNRATASRIAASFLAKHAPVVEMRFREKGRIVDIEWRAPDFGPGRLKDYYASEYGHCPVCPGMAA